MRVFVSGTSADLKSFRKATAEQLEKLSVEAVEQTYFGVDHRKLPMMLKDKVKTCDAMICLIGSVFGAAPPGSSRSYTQMEYDFARDFGKPTFLFFPSANCRLDQEKSLSGESAAPITSEDGPDKDGDTPEQREQQKKHADSIRSSTHLWSEFDNYDHVRLLTAEAVFKISPNAAGGPIARIVRTDFPTPLALLYDDYIPKGDALSLRSFANELLRFITVLALHDSVVHRIFGCQSADRKERSQTLALPEGPSDWRSLLSLSCPSDDQPCGARFITEFAGWDAPNARSIDKIVDYDRALLKSRRSESEEELVKVRAAMNSIIGDLGFLERYVLVAVTEVNSETGKCNVTVLRGLAARSFELAADPQSSLYPETNQLYLLNVDRRQALWLTPSFRYDGAAGDDRVYAWDRLDPDGNKDNDTNSESVTTLMAFSEDEISISERRDTLSAWLGEDLCEDAFGFRIQARPIAWVGKLLDDDSWNKIREVVLPPGEPSVLGERFRRASVPLHRGLHADVYEATDIGSGPFKSNTEDAVAVPAQPVVHVLLESGSADEQVREWFRNRSDCWRQTKHPGVLRLYESSDPDGKKGRPFLLTDLVPGSGSLEKLIPQVESVTEKTVMQAITLAAEVCHAAHQQGIFLLSLPPRHFLMDEGDNLFLTGFETAIPGRSGNEFPISLLKRLSRFSRDLDMMAPEVRNDLGTFSPTLDVFAIGSLLAQLRGLPTGAMDVLPDHNWGDPWHCLAYHCLAADPNVRFQSAEQILMFLNELQPGDEPRTVAVEPTATEPGFAIGKYPVTNADYRQFCLEKVYLLPPHLRAGGRKDEDHRAEVSRRLGGPWLPVTYVSLLDAQKYCQWLTERTNKKWRLPKETEWLRAASSGSDGEYPWGNEAPDPTMSNYGKHYRGPTVVGTFCKGRSHANCWDMAGNVWEWCTDSVQNGAPRRVVKGGAYDYSTEVLQLTSVDARVVTCRSPHVGFRVLCEENR